MPPNRCRAGALSAAPLRPGDALALRPLLPVRPHVGADDSAGRDASLRSLQIDGHSHQIGQ
jgi:hypothetical protein